jgi:hypothetical protein
MAYIINRYNGTILTTVEDGTVNTTTELKFIGKNFAGYGEAQNENMLFLLENFANSSAPTRPISGMIWYDTGTNKLKFYDGARWKSTGGADVSSTAPTGYVEGDFYWNNTTEQLYARNDNNEWVLVGPQAAGTGTTQLRSLTVTDSGANSHAIIAAYIEDEVIYVISPDTFTLSVASAITGFDVIRKGLTLVNTTSSTLGITSSDHRYVGTATNAERLGGLLPSDFQFESNLTTRSTPLAFNDFGFTIGDDVDILYAIDADSETPLIKLLRNKLKIQNSSSVDVLNITNVNITPAADGTFNLGTSANKFGTIHATSFTGTATQADTLKLGASYVASATAASPTTIAARDSNGDLFARFFDGVALRARYADLAEKYTTSEELPVGTAVAVCSHDTHEVEPASASRLCIGVVSAEPAYLMNSEAAGQAIGLKGRLPVRVIGPVKKGDPIYAWQNGVCTTMATTGLVGVALESNVSEEEKLVECVLKV